MYPNLRAEMARKNYDYTNFFASETSPRNSERQNKW